jgi:hypothetical protein
MSRRLGIKSSTRHLQTSCYDIEKTDLLFGYGFSAREPLAAMNRTCRACIEVNLPHDVDARVRTWRAWEVALHVCLPRGNPE